MSEESLLLQAVSDVARLAGAVARASFNTQLTIETKRDGSPVTAADRAAENAAREWITRNFPHDDILGEEFDPVAHGGPRRWIIDPIDGTKSFVRGVPLWGTLIGVAVGSDIVAGAAFFPALDELLCAARGEGCWWNGARTRVSTTDRVSDATVLTTDERFTAAPQHADAWQRLASRAALSRSWGDCYGYLLVATGRADVMVDGALSPWDAAALVPAVIEAGGVFTDWCGTVTSFGGNAIATNAALAVEARDILGVSSSISAP